MIMSPVVSPKGDFDLDPKLQDENFFICDLPLSHVLLHNDQRFPWLILVPRIYGVHEIFELSTENQSQLNIEVIEISRFLKKYACVQKINVGALGNIVTQLHIHIVGRNTFDAAWPNPVWGYGNPVPYRKEQLDDLLREYRQGIERLELRTN
jgi:diadenosine tetraphosphate (Ap4A) HIT family hydrolase